MSESDIPPNPRPKEVVALVWVCVILALLPIFLRVLSLFFEKPNLSDLPYFLALLILLAGSVGLWRGKTWGRKLLIAFSWILVLYAIGNFARNNAWQEEGTRLGFLRMGIPDVFSLMLLVMAICLRIMFLDKSIISYCREKTAGLFRKILGWLLLALLLVAFYYIGDYIGFHSWHLKGGHFRAVSQVVLSPDGNLLASGSRDRTVRLWEIQTGKSLGVLTGHKEMVTGLAFSPDGKLLASSSHDKTIKLWEMDSGKLLKTFTRPEVGEIFAVAFDPQGKLVASLEKSGVRIWQIATGQCLQTLTGGKTDLTVGLGYDALFFSPDSNWIISGHENTQIWDLKTGKLSKATFNYTPLAMKPDGNMLVLGRGLLEGDLCLLDLANGEILEQYPSPKDFSNLSFFQPSRDWQYVAACAYDKSPVIFRLMTGQVTHRLRGQRDPARAIAFDGTTLATGDGEGVVRVWQVGEEKPRFVLRRSWFATE